MFTLHAETILFLGVRACGGCVHWKELDTPKLNKSISFKEKYNYPYLPGTFLTLSDRMNEIIIWRRFYEIEKC